MDTTISLREQVRLTRIENFKNLAATFGSISDLARAIGRRQSQVSDMIKGRKSFGDAIARDIEKKLGLNEMALDHPGAEYREVNIRRSTTYRRIPVIHLEDLCDLAAALVKPNREELEVSDNVPEGSFAYKILGDSMSPDFLPGDYAIFSRKRTPKAGDYVAAVLERPGSAPEGVFRRYIVTAISPEGEDEFELHPINSVYPKLNSKTNKLTIVGVLIEHRRLY